MNNSCFGGRKEARSNELPAASANLFRAFQVTRSRDNHRRWRRAGRIEDDQGRRQRLQIEVDFNPIALPPMANDGCGFAGPRIPQLRLALSFELGIDVPHRIRIVAQKEGVHTSNPLLDEWKSFAMEPDI